MLYHEEGASLILPFGVDEIKEAVWDCDSFKSPGPDGIYMGFIKDFWPELKDDILRFLKKFHRNGHLSKATEANLFTGYHVGSTNSTVIFHLQFVDDTLLMGGMSWANVRTLRAVLFLFEAMSGLKVNFHINLYNNNNKE
ncbi:hypothetical protein MTR_0009s0040 [Medicago truncatula]|uniref:RNA-directed DNA polymerase n=1 Tax=Medicago truncatula TaxID=3880 RepID=A0A072TKY0_MEDTR|nr:hypothetical protein MTR_0009s0040 [Medicago truncatula]